MRSDRGQALPPVRCFSGAAGLLALLLAVGLASCAGSPLADHDGIAFTAPKIGAADLVLPKGATENLVREMAGQAAGSRLKPVAAERFLECETVVTHTRIVRFEPAQADRTGAAEMDFLFTDLNGAPLFASSIFVLDPSRSPDPTGARLAKRSGRSFGQQLRRFAPGPARATRAGAASPAPPVLDLPAPRASWPPVSHPGRIAIGLESALRTPGPTSVGEGAAAPSWNDLYAAATEASVVASYAACPGVLLEAGAGMARFRGRRFDSAGLEIDAESLDVTQVLAGIRLDLPLLKKIPRRWWSHWDPFPDTRGIRLTLCGRVFGGATNAVDGVVVADRSGEIPTLESGDRRQLFLKGGVMAAEFRAGVEIHLGEAGLPWVRAGMEIGGYTMTPPPGAGPATDAEALQGWVVALRLGISF